MLSMLLVTEEGKREFRNYSFIKVDRPKLYGNPLLDTPVCQVILFGIMKDQMALLLLANSSNFTNSHAVRNKERGIQISYCRLVMTSKAK